MIYKFKENFIKLNNDKFKYFFHKFLIVINEKII